MKRMDFDLFRLEDRVLFEAAAVAEIVDAAEAAQDNPNANVSESEKQAQEDRDTLKNAPPENSAAQTGQNDGKPQGDPSEAADVDAQVEQLIQGEIPAMDGDAEVTIPEIGDSSSVVGEAEESGNLVDAVIVSSDATISSGKELVVINDTVPDRDAILAELKLNQEVLILEDGTGLAELNKYLDAHEGKYDAIHLVTHGNEGYIFVNSEKIDADNFDSAEWKAVGEHLTDDGDILLYGCNTAETDDGRLLVDKIAEASGADVAASVDITGIGGDWELEYASGTVETSEISVAGFDYRLTDHNVTSNTDSGDNTLRWALEEAQDGDSISFTLGSNNTIMLNSTLVIEINRFKLQGVTIDGGNTNGDNVILDGGNTVTPPMDGSLTYEANGVQIMAISGYNIVTLQNLTFQNGAEEHTGGGAIYCSSSTLTVSNSIFVGNSSYSGGAIYCINSDLTVINSIFERNSSVTASGAICAIHGVSTVRNSTFVENSAYGSGGAIFLGCDGSGGDLNAMVADSTFIENSSITGSGGAIVFYHYWPLNYTNLTIENSKFEGNSAGGQGGALSITDCSLLSIKESTFKNNSAGGNGGAIYLEYIHKSPDNRIIENSTFSENSADNAGGAIYDFNTDYAFTPLVVNGGIFSKNSALHGMGGAIASVREEGNGSSSRYWDIIVNGAVLKENTASRAGAIWADSRIIINNCSIINNSAKTVGAIELTTSKLWDTAPIIANTTFAENRETEENSGCVFLSAHTGYVAKLDIINCIILGAQENAYDIALSDKAKLIGCSVQVYNSLTGNVSPSVALKDGNKTGVRYQDVFKINADGSLIMNSDGSIPIKNKGLAAGNGVYVWHADSYTRIAYSKSPTGIDKTLIRGNFETDNKIDIDQHGKKREYVTDIGSLIRDEVFSVDITVNNDLYTYNGKSQGSSGYTWVAPIPEFTIDDTEAVYTYTDAEDVVSTEAPVNTGEYSVTVSGLKLLYEGQEVSADKYIFNYIPGTVTITPKEITVTADAVTQVYGDPEKALTYQTNGLIADDTLSGSLERASGKTVGEYAIMQGTLANSNYNIHFTGADYTITKRDLTITAGDILDHTYGTAYTLSYTSNTLGIGDRFTGNLAIDPNDANKSRSGNYAVGNHAITIGSLDIVDESGVDMSDNYNIHFNEGTLNIVQAVIEVATVEVADKVYDGTTSATLESWSFYNPVANADALHLSGTASFGTKHAGSGKVASVKDFVLTGADAGNYILQSEVELTTTATIEKATLSIVLDDAAKGYGSADPGFTVKTAVGLQTGDKITGIDRSDKGENVGKYAIDQYAIDDGNGGNNYTVESFTPGTLTISSKVLTIAIDNVEFTYNGAEQFATSYTANGLETGDVITSLTVEGVTDAGIYSIAATAAEIRNNGQDVTGNYTISFVRNTDNVTVKAADVIVTALDSVATYGEDYFLKHDGLLFGDDAFTGELAVIDGSASSSGKLNAGTYTIGQGTLDAGRNYNLIFHTGVLTVNKAKLSVGSMNAADRSYDGSEAAEMTGYTFDGLLTGDQVTLTGTGKFADRHAGTDKAVTFGDLAISGADSGNYHLATDHFATTADISRAAIEIRANDAGKGYGSSDPALSYTILSGKLYGTDTIDISREAGENVGNYAIDRYEVNDGNGGGDYEVVFTPGNFTIGARSAVITVGTTTVGYNGDVQSATEYTIDGLESGHSVYQINLGGARNAGTHTVTVESIVIHDADGNDVTANYGLSYQAGTLEIQQAEITVHATAETMTYGEQANAGYTYNGTLYGSDEFTGALSIAGAMNSQNTLYAAGTAHFERGTLGIADGNNGGNYRITFVGADLTVKAKEISLSTVEIQDKVYDGTTDAAVLTAMVAGMEAGDSLSVVTDGASASFVSKNVGTDVEVNADGFVLAGADRNNYILKSDSFKTTADITKANLTIYTQNASKIYGDNDPGFTFSADGLKAGDSITDLGRSNIGTNVGSYEIDLYTLNDGNNGNNYNVTLHTGKLTITPKDITVTADAQTKVYGEADPELTYQVSGLVGNDTLAGSLTRAVGEDVGAYEITQGTLANSNYNISFIGANLTITAKSDVVVKPSGLNFDQYSEAVNPNFSALHPALTGRGLASVGLFSRLNENVYAMNHSALHAHLELRNGLRGSINNETASGRAVLPIDHSMMTIDAPLKNHSGFLFSRTMVMKPEALANGKEIMIDSSFAELRHMENTSAEKTHSSWHFLPESVKLPRSFFIDDVPAEELPDPAYDLRGIRAELPRRADAFKSELDLLLEELVGA